MVKKLPEGDVYDVDVLIDGEGAEPDFKGEAILEAALRLAIFFFIQQKW